MKRWLFLLLTAPAFAQNATVTANLKTLGGAAAQPTGASIRVDLQNCASPRVPGTGNIGEKSRTFYPNTSGIVTVTLYSNTVIDCGAGVPVGAPASFYTFNLVSNGGVTSLGSYKVPAGSTTLDTLTPITTTPVIPTPSGDNSYLRLDLGNFSNLVQPVPNWAVLGNLSGTNITGTNITGTTINATTFNGTGNASFGGDLLVGDDITAGGDITAACPAIQDATHFCIDKFNGSNRGTVTTTGTFAAGTSGSVASCSTFLAGQGVFITGAGGAGSNYVGAVVSCTGTAMVVTPATSTAVSGVLVQHDESAAFQNAINSIQVMGGTIYLPDGTYLVNGPRQDTAHANAVIKLPNLNYGASATPAPVIEIQGFTHPSTESASGAIIFSSIPSGNVFGAYNPGSPAQFVGFTNYFVDIDNVTFRAPHNPGMVMLNLTNAIATRIGHVRCDTGTNGDSPLPTTTTSGCLYMPSYGNNVTLSVQDLSVSGYANAVWAYEHASIERLIEANNINGLIPDSGPLGVLDGPNSIHVGYFWCQVCTNQLSAGLNPANLQIDIMDIETATAYGINDPSNLLHGIVNYLVPGGAGAVTPTNPSVNSALALCLNNIKWIGYSQNCYWTTGQGSPSVTAGTAAGSGATVSLVAGSNDKSGTIVLNTGSSGMAANGQLVIVTLQSGKRMVAIPVLQPANLATPGVGVWVSSTPTANNNIWNINSGTSALPTGTTFKWNYTSGGYN